MSKIPSSFNNFKSLNRGSVWALYLLLVIILSARFCNLNNLLHSKPQHVIPNCRCDRIKESYISFMTEIGRYLLSLFITPRVRDILLAIFEVCALQLTNSFRDSLLTASQSEILRNSKFIKAVTRPMSSLPPWVNEHKGLIIVVSSAYKINFRLALTLWISFIYTMNSRGPNIEPWGTPVSISRVDEGMSSYSTYRRRCVR